jgi:hypothetical protein
MTMNTSRQSLVDAVAAVIANRVGTDLRASPDSLDANGQLTPSQLPKFAGLGKDFAMQVISNWWSSKQGGKRHRLTREEMIESLIEWLSSEVSKKISNDLIDYTITRVTQQRLSPSTMEEIVDGNVEIDAPPFLTMTLARFDIKYSGLPAMSLTFTLQVEGKVAANDVLTKLQTEPVLRVEEIDFRDCEVGLEISGPGDITIKEFTVPIKGTVSL